MPSVWNSAIIDLINYGLKPVTNLPNALYIIENIAVEFNTGNIILMDRKKVHECLIQQLTILLDCIPKILELPSLLPKSKKKIISCLNAWSQIEKVQLLDNINVISILENAFSNKDLCKNAIKCLMHCFEKSPFAQVWQDQPLEIIYNNFFSSYLIPLITALLDLTEKNIQSGEKNIKYYSDNTFCVATNFPMIILRVNIFFHMLLE